MVRASACVPDIHCCETMTTRFNTALHKVGRGRVKHCFSLVRRGNFKSSLYYVILRHVIANIDCSTQSSLIKKRLVNSYIYAFHTNYLYDCLWRWASIIWHKQKSCWEIYTLNLLKSLIRWQSKYNKKNKADLERRQTLGRPWSINPNMINHFAKQWPLLF